VRCEQPLTRRFPNGETHLHHFSSTRSDPERGKMVTGITKLNKIGFGEANPEN
jgi:hypothetical protein